ncbi:MAG: tyrosine-type recombinase/integrase [Acidimicrobiales bacterium]
MSPTAPAARRSGEGLPLLDRLATAVRPEFSVDVYVPDPGDPVLGRDRCAVAACTQLSQGRGLCGSHYDRWRRAGKPAIEAWTASATPLAARAGPHKTQCFDLRPLGAQARLEVAYALQCRHDARGFGPDRPQVARAVRLLAEADATSVLDRTPEAWRDLARSQGWQDLACIAFIRYTHTVVADLAAERTPADEYERDTWDSRRLGIPARPPNYLIRFGSIRQPWLREGAKRWARFRLGTGRAVSTVANDIHGLDWFSELLAESDPGARDASVVTRRLLESYLSHLAGAGLADQTRLGYLVSLRIFLDHCRRHSFLADLPAEARLYPEDMPGHGEYLPRFIPEFVMAQLESDANLDHLPDATTRHLVITLIETGLRSSDACNLPVDAVIDDSVGWPCLRFYNSKVRTEQLVPLSPKAAAALRAQGEIVRRDWPAGTRFLFPRERANPDGIVPFSYATLHRRLRAWQADIDVRDDAGHPFRATAHQFRHTLGTRMINLGVPEHVIQRLLGHASAEMTARYARLHDTTLRAAFDDYCQARVNIAGEVLGFEPDAPTADAEWVKHRLGRVQASLPNGFCGRPPQQDCPHPNACLTCPDFQTTTEFLAIHRQQADNTRILIATAEANGQFRLVANHRQVLDNLERIIPALETIGEADDAS